MDIRQKAFYVNEADAIHRQEMGRIANAVAAGFSDRAGFNQFIAKLELSKSAEENADDTWELIYTLAGNK